MGETSLSIAIQDGPEVGQIEEQVHAHLLPRKKGDFESNEDVYKVLDEHDKQQIESNKVKNNFFRSEEDMSKEAASLAFFSRLVWSRVDLKDEKRPYNKIDFG